MGAVILGLLACLAWAEDNPWLETLEAPGEPVPVSVSITPDAAVAPSGDPLRRGHRIAGIAARSQVSVGSAAVLGGDGGTQAFDAEARVVTPQATVSARLHFAAYRGLDERSTDVGNLFVGVHHTLDRDRWRWAIGGTMHAMVGGQAYTWVNRPEELWPGAGADAEVHFETKGATAALASASMGLHHALTYKPFPPEFFRAAMAGAVDQRLGPYLAATAEVSLAWWDTSPIELAGMLRLEPVEGLQISAGAVLPVAAWAGWTPTARPSGVREATVVARFGLSP
jgi:hypothetical protein